MTIFRRFPITFRRFPKIFQNRSEGQTNVSGHFPNIFEDFPKIAEDCRSRPKKIRGCFDHTLTNFSVVEGTKEKYCQIWYLHMWRYHIFTCEDIISFLSICYHSVYHWLLYNNFKLIHFVAVSPPVVECVKWREIIVTKASRVIQTNENRKAR